MTEFRPDLIQLVLDKLHPPYVRVGVVSQRYEGKTNYTEPWYNSQYNVRKIDQVLINAWSAACPIKELYLPAENEFIPTDFDLVPLDKDKASKVPKLVVVSFCSSSYSLFKLMLFAGQ